MNKIINREDIKLTFKRIGATESFNVYSKDENPKYYGICSEEMFAPDFIPSIDNTELDVVIAEEFKKFQQLPEYFVGKAVPEEAFKSQESMVYELEFRIIGCYHILYGDDKADALAERCITWLRSTDFYMAPASTKYHDAEAVGLLKHTLKVINKLYELMTMKTFKEVDCAQATVAAIVHDWCKIDFYEGYMRNVKNEEGVWEQVPSFRCKGSSIPLGHGVTSMFIAQKFFKLTTEMALAIRWHMGEYDVSENQSHDLMDANERYPMVLLLQTADRLSII